MSEKKYGNGKTDDQVRHMVKGLLAEDPTMSSAALSARAGVHYSVVDRMKEELRKRGELPKLPGPEEYPDLPIPQNIVNLKFTPIGDCIKVIPFADAHIGGEKGTVDWDLIRGVVKYVVDHQDTYTILMGDLTDGAIHGLGSIRGHPSPFKALYNMGGQWSVLLKKVIEPLARNGKILGLIPGDHDTWIDEDRGMDLNAFMVQSISDLTGWKVPYLTDGAWLNLTVGEQYYTVYARHGDSSAKTDGGRRQVVDRQFGRINADMKLSAHQHMIDAWKTPSYNQAVIKKGYTVMCGTFFKYEKSYAEKWGLNPGITGVAKLKFFKDRWDMHVSI